MWNRIYPSPPLILDARKCFSHGVYGYGLSNGLVGSLLGPRVPAGGILGGSLSWVLDGLGRRRGVACLGCAGFVGLNLSCRTIGAVWISRGRCLAR